MKEKDELTELCVKIERGLEISFDKLIAFKKYKNTPFVFERNGNIVEMSAEEVESEMNESKKTKSYKKENEVHLVNEPSKKASPKG